MFLALVDGSYMSEALEICKKCKAEQDKQVNEILEMFYYFLFNSTFVYSIFLHFEIYLFFLSSGRPLNILLRVHV